MLNIRNYVMIPRVIKLTEVDCCQIYEGRKRLIDTFASNILEGIKLPGFGHIFMDVKRFIVYYFKP